MRNIKNNKKRNKEPSKKFSTRLDLANISWERVEKIFFTDRSQFQDRIEKEEKTKARIKEILKVLAGGAVIGVSFLIPTAPMALAPFLIEKNKFDQSTYNRAISRLEKQKLVKIVYEDEQTLIKITEKGRVRALRYKLSEIQVKKPKVWDKKWRIVIFDIPEKHKRMREIFRDHLKMMGFYMLQKSVWVHPYPCADEIEFLRQVFSVSINVTYILAEKIENTEGLEEHFKL